MCDNEDTPCSLTRCRPGFTAPNITLLTACANGAAHHAQLCVQQSCSSCRRSQQVLCYGCCNAGRQPLQLCTKNVTHLPTAPALVAWQNAAGSCPVGCDVRLEAGCTHLVCELVCHRSCWRAGGEHKSSTSITQLQCRAVSSSRSSSNTRNSILRCDACW